MPLVTCRSNIFATERSYPLRVAITHTLSVLPAHLVEYEDPKAGGLPVRLRATTIPPNLDVRLPGSQLVVRIHGFICGKRVESKAVAQSGLLFEFNRFVLKNMDVIGLETISGPSVDGDYVKFLVTPCGTYDPPVSSPSDVSPVYLHQIDIDVMWGTKSRIKDSVSSHAGSSQSHDTRRSSREKDLFNSDMDVEDVVPWLQIMEKMFATHFIRRYPLIFGRWKLNLAEESTFFPSITRSIAAILRQSNNKAFKSQAKKTFNTLQTHRKRVVDGSWAALSSLRASSGCASIINEDDATNFRHSLPPSDQDGGGDDGEQMSFEKAISDAMTRLYRLHIRPGKRLKFTSTRPDGAILDDVFNDEEHADYIIRGIDDEDLSFDSPTPSILAIQHSQAVQADVACEIVDDNNSDILSAFSNEGPSIHFPGPFASHRTIVFPQPPTDWRLAGSLDLEDDDLDSLIDDIPDTDSLMDADFRPATPACLPFSPPQVWTPSDDGMDIDLCSPVCMEASLLPIDSDNDCDEEYIQLAWPSPSPLFRARTRMEFDDAGRGERRV